MRFTVFHEDSLNNSSKYCLRRQFLVYKMQLHLLTASGIHTCHLVVHPYLSVSPSIWKSVITVHYNVKRDDVQWQRDNASAKRYDDVRAWLIEYKGHAVEPCVIDFWQSVGIGIGFAIEKSHQSFWFFYLSFFGFFLRVFWVLWRSCNRPQLGTMGGPPFDVPSARAGAQQLTLPLL
jgi:hypothetical protein